MAILLIVFKVTVSVPVSPIRLGDSGRQQQGLIPLSIPGNSRLDRPRADSGASGAGGEGDDSYIPGMPWAKWLQNSLLAWTFCAFNSIRSKEWLP